MHYILNPTPTRTALGAAWAAVLDGLIVMLGFHITARNPMAHLLDRAAAQLLRTLNRIDRVAFRWQTNTLPRRRIRPPRATPAKPAKPRLANARHMWLIRLLQPTAQYAGHVEALLIRPATQRLVADAPQAGRLLRPLCRGLGVPLPDWLRLPPQPPRPPAPKPAAEPAQPKRFRAELPGMLPTDRPLPHRVVAAARYYRKKYGPGG